MSFFIRKWEKEPASWVFGRLPDGGTFYLKANNFARAKEALRKWYGCVVFGAPSKLISEEQLVRRFAKQDWPVCGRLLNYE